MAGEHERRQTHEDVLRLARIAHGSSMTFHINTFYPPSNKASMVRLQFGNDLVGPGEDERSETASRPHLRHSSSLSRGKVGREPARPGHPQHQPDDYNAALSRHTATTSTGVTMSGNGDGACTSEPLCPSPDGRAAGHATSTSKPSDSGPASPATPRAACDLGSLSPLYAEPGATWGAEGTKGPADSVLTQEQEQQAAEGTADGGADAAAAQRRERRRSATDAPQADPDPPPMLYLSRKIQGAAPHRPDGASFPGAASIIANSIKARAASVSGSNSGPGAGSSGISTGAGRRAFAKAAWNVIANNNDARATGGASSSPGYRPQTTRGGRFGKHPPSDGLASPTSIGSRMKYSPSGAGSPSLGLVHHRGHPPPSTSNSDQGDLTLDDGASPFQSNPSCNQSPSQGQGICPPHSPRPAFTAPRRMAAQYPPHIAASLLPPQTLSESNTLPLAASPLSASPSACPVAYGTTATAIITAAASPTAATGVSPGCCSSANSTATSGITGTGNTNVTATSAVSFSSNSSNNSSITIGATSATAGAVTDSNPALALLCKIAHVQPKPPAEQEWTYEPSATETSAGGGGDGSFGRGHSFSLNGNLPPQSPSATALAARAGHVGHAGRSDSAGGGGSNCSGGGDTGSASPAAVDERSGGGGATSTGGDGAGAREVVAVPYAASPVDASATASNSDAGEPAQPAQQPLRPPLPRQLPALVVPGGGSGLSGGGGAASPLSAIACVFRSRRMSVGTNEERPPPSPTATGGLLTPRSPALHNPLSPSPPSSYGTRLGGASPLLSTQPNSPQSDSLLHHQHSPHHHQHHQHSHSHNRPSPLWPSSWDQVVSDCPLSPQVPQTCPLGPPLSQLNAGASASQSPAGALTDNGSGAAAAAGALSGGRRERFVSSARISAQRDGRRLKPPPSGGSFRSPSFSAGGGVPPPSPSSPLTSRGGLGSQAAGSPASWQDPSSAGAGMNPRDSDSVWARMEKALNFLREN